MEIQQNLVEVVREKIVVGHSNSGSYSKSTIRSFYICNQSDADVLLNAYIHPAGVEPSEVNLVALNYNLKFSDTWYWTDVDGLVLPRDHEISLEANSSASVFKLSTTLCLVN